MATFLLNGALFVLVGLELQAAARTLASADLAKALIVVSAVSAVLIAVRLAFLYVAPNRPASIAVTQDSPWDSSSSHVQAGRDLAAPGVPMVVFS